MELNRKKRQNQSYGIMCDVHDSREIHVFMVEGTEREVY